MKVIAVSFRVFFFFFSSRRRHTRLVSDWSSDVCSSDLLALWLRISAGRNAHLPIEMFALPKARVGQYFRSRPQASSLLVTNSPPPLRYTLGFAHQRLRAVARTLLYFWKENFPLCHPQPFPTHARTRNAFLTS